MLLDVIEAFDSIVDAWLHSHVQNDGTDVLGYHVYEWKLSVFRLERFVHLDVGANTYSIPQHKEQNDLKAENEN